MSDQDEQANEVEDLERVFNDACAKPIKIAYEVLKSITKSFAQEIGSGAFGVVYLGELQNGMVAVKKIMTIDLSDEQYLDEVACLIMLKHKNIVRFLGYCADSHGKVMEMGNKFIIAEERERLLCFEYAPNGNLHHYLSDKNRACVWHTRYKIIKGICQGLHYLHKEHINHFDLKPENVLLGEHFGLSRNFGGGRSTIVTKNIFGTPGYIAPEFFQTGQISSKSDIYSLGQIMKKLLLGSETTENWYESLDEDCPLLKKCIEIAKICDNSDPKERPTIDYILDQLNDTEAMIQMVPITIYEPRNDPASSLYKV